MVLAEHAETEPAVSSGYVVARWAQGAKKGDAGPLGVPRSGLTQMGPLISLAHLCRENRGLLQPVMGLPLQEQVIGAEKPST